MSCRGYASLAFATYQRDDAQLAKIPALCTGDAPSRFAMSTVGGSNDKTSRPRCPDLPEVLPVASRSRTRSHRRRFCLRLRRSGSTDSRNSPGINPRSRGIFGSSWNRECQCCRTTGAVYCLSIIQSFVPADLALASLINQSSKRSGHCSEGVPGWPIPNPCPPS